MFVIKDYKILLLNYYNIIKGLERVSGGFLVVTELNLHPSGCGPAIRADFARFRNNLKTVMAAEGGIKLYLHSCNLTHPYFPLDFLFNSDISRYRLSPAILKFIPNILYLYALKNY